MPPHMTLSLLQIPAGMVLTDQERGLSSLHLVPRLIQAKRKRDENERKEEEKRRKRRKKNTRVKGKINAELLSM